MSSTTTTAASLPKTMKAVIFHGTRKVAVEDRPVPVIQANTDVIVKVSLTALCGSELHVYRGHQASEPGFIMGHEFTGQIVEVGSAVKGFLPGDKVVAPFTVSWYAMSPRPSPPELMADIAWIATTAATTRPRAAKRSCCLDVPSSTAPRLSMSACPSPTERYSKPPPRSQRKPSF